MFSKYSVKKPLTALVAIIIIAILGGVSYTNMTIDLLPSMNLPYAVVSTTYVGASPEEIETTITAPIEQAMASVSNVDEVSSISQENSSMVVLKFVEDADMDACVTDMREMLDLIESALPEEAGNPTILKLNPNMMPIMAVSASVEGQTISQSSEYIDDTILPELKTTEGVASVSADGLVENQITITLNQDKIDKINSQLRGYVNRRTQSSVDEQVNAQLAQLPEGVDKAAAEAQIRSQIVQNMPKTSSPKIEITTEMLEGILQGQNFSMPAGSVDDESSDVLVRVGDKVADVDAVGQLVLMNLPSIGDVTIEDVADITVSDNSTDMYTKVNGEDAVVLMLQKQPNYSTAEVTQNVADKMATLQSEHPEVHLTTIMDQGEYVGIMIDTIVSNLVTGGLLAILILLFFLKDWKPTVIVGASIVVSVVTAFVLMYFSGVTLNIISMSGLALGVGMLVDNSIVVIENIYRLRSLGVPPRKAAIQGAKQVSGAIFSSTLTTVIVFVPIVFVQGMTRQIFADMGLTIAYSLLASLLVALTLVPAGASTVLRRQPAKKNKTFDRLNHAYQRSLSFTLKHKSWVILVVVALLGVSLYGASQLGTELFPANDMGQLTLSVTLPEDATEQQARDTLGQISDILMQNENVDTVGVLGSTGSSSMMSMVGGDATSIYVLLKDERSASTTEVAQQVRESTQDIPAEISINSQGADLSSMTGDAIAIEIYGQELDDLRQNALSVAEMLSQVEGVTEIEDGLGKKTPELRITVDKTEAIKNGLTTGQVYAAVQAEIKQPSAASSLTQDGTTYDIYVNSGKTVDKQALESLKIENSEGKSIALKEIASFTTEEGFDSISRNGQERYVTVSAQLSEGYNIGKVSQTVQAQLDEMDLSGGCRAQLAGQNEMIEETFSNLFLMMGLAIIFIYLVMVAQFQSLLSPFIIMFTIPLAFTGGLLALMMTGNPISTVALIGFIILAGIVVNNGIVFVDYVNQLRSQGMDTKEALLRAGQDRLRPILMTALTTIIAMSTMCFDPSAGAAMMRPMAITTIGGLLYATVLTLYLVPALYMVMHKKPPKPRDPEDEPDDVLFVDISAETQTAPSSEEEGDPS